MWFPPPTHTYLLCMPELPKVVSMQDNNLSNSNEKLNVSMYFI